MLSAIRHKVGKVPMWIYWFIFAVVGLFILILNDVFGEQDGFVVFSLFYFAILTVFIVNWVFIQIKSVLKLRRDKVDMEMQHLKSQVNPHFFFNTLNNLYGMVEKDPKEAQSLILKLSDLMRYSIYEGQNEMVALQEEISYLENYINLQKDRYHKSITVEFKKDIGDDDFQIMPLLLIILVENAFKHGVEKLRNDAYVHMNLAAKGRRIDFSIQNNFDQEEVNKHKGIGLANLRRRLEIGYKKAFDLQHTSENNVFSANLSLYKV